MLSGGFGCVIALQAGLKPSARHPWVLSDLRRADGGTGSSISPAEQGRTGCSQRDCGDF